MNRIGVIKTLHTFTATVNEQPWFCISEPSTTSLTAFGISGAAAPTWMASYGANCSHPWRPSPTTSCSWPDLSNLAASGDLLTLSIDNWTSSSIWSMPTATPFSPTCYVQCEIHPAKSMIATYVSVNSLNNQHTLFHVCSVVLMVCSCWNICHRTGNKDITGFATMQYTNLRLTVTMTLATHSLSGYWKRC